jgi:hypothetical protein
MIMDTRVDFLGAYPARVFDWGWDS